MQLWIQKEECQVNVNTKQGTLINGMHVHLMPSKKFKTNTVEVKFQTKISRDTITRLALLPTVLRTGCLEYKTKAEVQEQLDNLYGAGIGIGAWKSGKNHILNFQMDMANEKFIPNENTLAEEAFSFLNKMIFHPNVIDGAFDEATVAKEKETLRRQLEAMKDNKMSYANTRLIDEMAEGEVYAIHGQGYAEDLEVITGKSLYDAYAKVLETARVDLFITGDFNSEKMESTIRKALVGLTDRETEAKSDEMTVFEEMKSVKEVKEVVEYEDIQQAKLHIGYRTLTNLQDEGVVPMLVGSMILGGYMGSLLFMNVREKHSLAYYVNANMDAFSDKLFIYSGIAGADYEKTMQIIDEQIEALQKGEFTDGVLEESKSLLISDLKASQDNAIGMIDDVYKQILTGITKSSVDFIEEVAAVDKEAIMKAASKLEKDTIFFLTSKEAN